MIEVTDETFEQEVLNSEVPVVVDFSAAWCNPCRMMAPTLEQLSQEADGKIKFVKVDIESTEITAKYTVRAVPTLLFMVGGEVLDTLIGAQPKSKIAAWLMPHVPGAF